MHVPTPDRFSRHDMVPADHRLSSIERRVALLARDEADGGRFEPRTSALARLVDRLTGNEGPQPLADIRLEALRRFVCFERRNDGRARRVAAELTGHGFHPEALAMATAIAHA